jgi:hypothetical protein
MKLMQTVFSIHAIKQTGLVAILALVSVLLPAQAPVLVWPGDANNNGIVNSVDFLYLGLGYNYVGPVRPNATSAFAGQLAPSWNFGLGPASSNAGFNFAYTDCNGDGLINFIYDAFPIYVHYGLSHGTITPDVFPVGVPNVDPPIFFDLSAQDSIVNPGETLSLPIHLGTSALPIQDFYGIAFSIMVDPDWINLDTAAVVAAPAGTWINNDGDHITSIYKPADHRLDIAIVRTDHNDRNGNGYIGKFDFIIIDDVVGIQEQLQLRIDSIYLIDGVGNITAIAGDTVNFIIENPTAEQPEPSPQPRLTLYPNPAQKTLQIHASESLGLVSIFDISGRLVLRQVTENHSIELQLPDLPNGTYLLEVRSEAIIRKERFLVLRE